MTRAWHDVTAKHRCAPRRSGRSRGPRRKIDPDGRLAWEVPAGPLDAAPLRLHAHDGHEYDVDILDPEAVDGHFNRMGKAILDDAGPLAGKTLTHFYSVSWEGAAPTWTVGFDKQFRTVRGYACGPTCRSSPATRSRAARSPSASCATTTRRSATASATTSTARLRDLCHRHGLKWHSESGGPWDRKLAIFEEADQLAFLARNDMPQGEFWYTAGGSTSRHNRPRP